MGLDETLDRQVVYYRRRAAEYDETAVSDVEATNRNFASLIDRLDPTGDVLEIACGTGLWTQHLIGRAHSLTALDSSPEMIELAQSRLADAAPTFIVADVFDWHPERRYDSVFFGFWLSHVPQERFSDFWKLLDSCLAPAGRVLFVDEGAPRAGKEPAAALSPVIKRRLRDGTIHEIVKIYYELEVLRRRLADLHWSADIDLMPDGLLVATARRA
jgi:SAM-dependent methyltransferase